MGILAGHYLFDIITTNLWVAIAGTLAVATLIGYALRAAHVARATAGAAIMAIGGLLCHEAYEQSLVSWPATPAAYVGQVERVARQDSDKVTVDVALLHGDTAGRKVRLSLQAHPTPPLPGNYLYFRTAIKLPHEEKLPSSFSYRHYLLTHSLSGTAFVAASQWKETGYTGPLPLRLKMLRLRQRLAGRFADHLQGETLAVVCAMSLGDRSLLTPHTKALFSDSGVAHVLALSGLHLSILFGFFQLFLLHFKRRHAVFVGASLLLMATLWGFVLLTGAAFSLWRAALMLTCLQLTRCLFRQVDSMQNLLIAALLILVTQPLALFDVGFRLSFSAVAGILFFQRHLWAGLRLTLSPRWQHYYLHPPRFRGRAFCAFVRGIHACVTMANRHLLPFLTVTLSAVMATMPWLLLYFHNLTPYTLVGNLIAVPATAVLLVSSLLFLIVPGFGGILSPWMEWFCSGLLRGLEWLSLLPGSSLHVYLAPLTIAAAGLGGCLLLGRWLLRWRRWMPVAAAVSFAVAIASETYSRRPQRLTPQIVIYATSGVTALHFIANASTSYLVTIPHKDAAPAAHGLASQLDYVREHVWQPLHLSPPLAVAEGYTDHRLYRSNHCMAFGGMTIALPDSTYRSYLPANPLPVRLLVVTPRCRMGIKRLLRLYRPEQIIVAAGCSARRSASIAEVCLAQGIACHLLRYEGSFVYPLSPATSAP